VAEATDRIDSTLAQRAFPVMAEDARLQLVRAVLILHMPEDCVDVVDKMALHFDVPTEYNAAGDKYFGVQANRDKIPDYFQPQPKKRHAEEAGDIDINAMGDARGQAHGRGRGRGDNRGRGGGRAPHTPNDRNKQKNAGLVIELRSHLPIDQQVRAIGATSRLSSS